MRDGGPVRTPKYESDLLRYRMRIGPRAAHEASAFCNQCSLQLFGINYQDLLLSNIDAVGDRLVGCDKCGWTLVDAFGNCLLKGHNHVSNEEREYVSQYPEIMRRFFGDDWDKENVVQEEAASTDLGELLEEAEDG